MNARVLVLIGIVVSVFVLIVLPTVLYASVVDAITGAIFGRADTQGYEREDPFADLNYIQTAYKDPIADYLNQFSEEERAFLQAYTPPWSLILAIDRFAHEPKLKEDSKEWAVVSDHAAILDALLPRSVFLTKENVVEREVCVEKKVVERDPETGEEREKVEYEKQVETQKTPRRVFVHLDTYMGTYTFEPVVETQERVVVEDSPCGELKERFTFWSEQLKSSPDELYRPVRRILTAYGLGHRLDLTAVIAAAKSYDPGAPLVDPFLTADASVVNLPPGAAIVPDAEMLERIRAFYGEGREALLSSLSWPVPGHFSISSPFGTRADPFSGARAFHSGIDIPAPAGTPVVSAQRGTVVFSGWLGGYGNAILIDHGGGLLSLYGHLNVRLVEQGASVESGQTIGLVGSTGRSTGPHLHFEIRLNGNFTDPIAHYALKQGLTATVGNENEGRGKDAY